MAEASASDVAPSLMALLTPAEKSFVMKQRAVEVICRVLLTVVMPHWNESCECHWHSKA